MLPVPLTTPVPNMTLPPVTLPEALTVPVTLIPVPVTLATALPAAFMINQPVLAPDP